ncbi:DUF2913 family protein [Vibrio litoralis]|uniref:DUF2913 family protein n=1 Tax=Vibrio litoralis TaxID=335972 RepID=UPI0004257931|nr:DUF2913 family protein [Vibrio litoralis]
MTDSTFHKQLSDVLTNALLHLYLEVTKSQKFFTTQARNQIIIRYIKPLVKDRRYALVKKKLKTIALMKPAGESIEKRLIQIVDSYQSVVNPNDSEKLFRVLTHMEKGGIYSMLTESDDMDDQDILMVSEAQIAESFDADGLMLKPLTLFIKTEHPDVIERELSVLGFFSISASTTPEKTSMYEFTLSPLNT